MSNITCPPPVMSIVRHPMSTLTNGRVVVVAAIAALSVEALAYWAWAWDRASATASGNYSPSLYVHLFGLFHRPGVALVTRLQITHPEWLVFVFLTGAVQFFLLFWIPLTVWRWRRTT